MEYGNRKFDARFATLLELNLIFLKNGYLPEKVIRSQKRTPLRLPASLI